MSGGSARPTHRSMKPVFGRYATERLSSTPRPLRTRGILRTIVSRTFSRRSGRRRYISRASSSSTQTPDLTDGTYVFAAGTPPAFAPAFSKSSAAASKSSNASRRPCRRGPSTWTHEAMTRSSSRTPTPTAMNLATHGGAPCTTRPPRIVTNLSSTYSKRSRAERKNAWSLRHSPTPRVALSTRADIDASTACASLPRPTMARTSSRTPGLSLKYSTPSSRSFTARRFSVGRRNHACIVRRPAGVTHASAQSANKPHSLTQPTYCDGCDSTRSIPSATLAASSMRRYPPRDISRISAGSCVACSPVRHDPQPPVPPRSTRTSCGSLRSRSSSPSSSFDPRRRRVAVNTTSLARSAAHSAPAALTWSWASRATLALTAASSGSAHASRIAATQASMRSKACAGRGTMVLRRRPSSSSARRGPRSSSSSAPAPRSVRASRMAFARLDPPSLVPTTRLGTNTTSGSCDTSSSRRSTRSSSR